MTIYEFEKEDARRPLAVRAELVLMAAMLTTILAVAALALREPQPAEMEPIPAALPTAAGFTA